MKHIRSSILIMLILILGFAFGSIAYADNPTSFVVKKFNGTWYWPLGYDGSGNRLGSITSYVGGRNSPTAGASRNHHGTDIGRPRGSSVYAARGGTVYYMKKVFGNSIGWNNSQNKLGLGDNWLVIDHGDGYYTAYGHLSGLASFISNDSDGIVGVSAGQVIGFVGGGYDYPNEGVATGPHLHFETAFYSGGGGHVDLYGYSMSSWGINGWVICDNAPGTGQDYSSNPGPIIVDAQSLQFRDVVCPSTWVIKGAGWDLSSGTLVSDADLTAIRSEIIRKSDGYVVSDSGFKSISGHSYSLKTLDDYSGTNNGVRFSYIYSQGLGGGQYIWRLTGQDSWGRTIVLPIEFTAVTSGSDTNGRAEFIGPRTPSISVAASDNLHESAINWDATADTTHYDVRIWNSNDQIVWSRMAFSGGSSPNCLAMLDAGSYKAQIASCYSANGSATWVYSNTVNFTVSNASAPSAVTPIKSKEYGHKLYQLYQKDCTWREAKYLAGQSGGTFVSITSQGEQDAVAQLVSEGGFNAWIGAEAWRSYNTWQWVSGEAWTYSHWMTGEPNGSTGKENCGMIYVSSGEWNDAIAANSDVHGYIIEYAPTSVRVMPKTDVFGLNTAITKEDLTVEVTFSDGTTITTNDYIYTLSGTDAGEQTVTVKYGDLTASANVTVGGSRIVLSDNKVTMFQVDTCSLSATLYTTETPAPSLHWSCIHSGDTQWDGSLYCETDSSNPNVLWIASDIRTGDYIVTCETSDGKASASCIVTVLPAPITGISLNETSLSMHVNDQATLNASILPSYTTDIGVTWSSSDENVVRVDSGNVYANGVGTATITCASENNPAIKATCTVTVNVPVSAVILGHSVYEFGSPSESSTELHATIVPEDATDKTVTWSSSRPAVATVMNGIIRPVAPGYTRITCTSVDGPVGICDVVVHADNIMHLPVSLKEIEAEAFYGSAIQEVILPEGATTIESKAFANCNRLSLVYIPSRVASIASDAFKNSPNVAIISDGICTATQYAQNKGIPYIIGSMPEEVLVISYDDTLSVGRTMNLYSYVQPDNAPQAVKWSILEGASIASIEASGDECTLTATGIGHVTIGATAINGVMGTADISIIEHATEFDIWFDANGGTCNVNYLTAQFDEALGTLPVPTRDYHTFTGWYTTASGGTKVTSSTVYRDYDMGEITLYAHWTENAWSDWVEASALPSGDILTESKTQYRYQDANYSDWSGWSGWDENRQSTSELKEEESATVWFWYRYICPNCGKAMHVWDKCYAFADGCNSYIGSDKLQCCWLPVSSSGGTQDWLGTGRIMYGSNSYDRWFYWKDSSQGYPNGKSTTGYRYRTRTKSWGSWSGWTDTAVSASTTRNVETRNVYRYKVK